MTSSTTHPYAATGRLQRKDLRAAQLKGAAERAARLKHNELSTANRHRPEREAALRDDIWFAMRTGRYRRAASVIQPACTSLHRIKLSHEGGFISVAEFACRCAEREATHRAAGSCKTFEAAFAAMRILERATGTLERTKEVRPLWRDKVPQNSFVPSGGAEEPEMNEVGLFEEAFGDWAPAWTTNARGSWPTII